MLTKKQLKKRKNFVESKIITLVFLHSSKILSDLFETGSSEVFNFQTLGYSEESLKILNLENNRRFKSKLRNYLDVSKISCNFDNAIFRVTKKFTSRNYE